MKDNGKLERRIDAPLDRGADADVPAGMSSLYENLCKTADRATGLPRSVWQKTRREPCPLVRRAIMLRLSNAGYSYNSIGKLMGFGHSNVSQAMDKLAEQMAEGTDAKTTAVLRIFAGRYGWVNVTSDCGVLTAGRIWETREQALEHADNNTMNTIMIEY